MSRLDKSAMAKRKLHLNKLKDFKNHMFKYGQLILYSVDQTKHLAKYLKNRLHLQKYFSKLPLKTQ